MNSNFNKYIFLIIIIIIISFKRQEFLPLFHNTVLALSKNVWEKSPYLLLLSS